MTELKPCPFCGSKNIDLREIDDAIFKYYVKCNACHVSMADQNKPNIFKRWNNRIKDDTWDY